MIRAMLLEDIDVVRSELRELLEKSFSNQLNIIAEADSVASGISLIEEHLPDLLFLDIHFLDGTGFDILSKITHTGFNVIFITAYDNQAIRAIKAGALDYILKPLDEDELQKSVNKAIEMHKSKMSIDTHLEVTNENFQGVVEKRIILKTTESIYPVYEKDILYCESDGNYTTFHLLDRTKILVSKYIKQIEDLLSETTFIRCHRSYIVNKKHIKKFSKRGYFVMTNAIQIPVSRVRKEDSLKKAFQ